MLNDIEWRTATDAEKKAYLEANGYYAVEKMPDGHWKGLTRLMFTTAICLGLDSISLRYRFCFDDPAVALAELQKLNSLDDVPAGWLACRPAERFPQPCFLPEDKAVWTEPRYTPAQE